jgi:uncharacterized protein (DUF885 family)
MDASRQFVLDKEIATIPDGESLRVIEMPHHIRSVCPYCAYMPPGIFEKQQDGLFLVTPVEDDDSAERREQKLKGHFRHMIPVTALHEGYPGHHLQFVWANTRETVPRRLGSFLATMFIEGWAFYCEELLEELGFISGPMQRLVRLNGQLWRAARIILDVSIHTRGMSVVRAVDYLVRQCGHEPVGALAEIRRYSQTPTYPQSYLMGKLHILDLVEQYRRANPDLSMKQMHDTLLGCGSLPVSLMKKRLLGE